MLCLWQGIMLLTAVPMCMSDGGVCVSPRTFILINNFPETKLPDAGFELMTFRQEDLHSIHSSTEDSLNKYYHAWLHFWSSLQYALSVARLHAADCCANVLSAMCYGSTGFVLMGKLNKLNKQTVNTLFCLVTFLVVLTVYSVCGKASCCWLLCQCALSNVLWKHWLRF